MQTSTMANTETTEASTVEKNIRRISWRQSLLFPFFSLLVVASAASVTGCRTEMYDQPKERGLRMSTFFADSQSARPIIEGTVPRSGRIAGAPDALIRDTSSWMYAPSVQAPAAGDSGATSASTGARKLLTIAEIRTMSIPAPVTRQLLDRGRERFNIYCSPCHGRTGDGNGMIVQRGFPQPPSFHLDRLRSAPDGHYYDVITNGFGVMFNYAYRVKPDDRWAITAYIRALQLSRNADAPVRTAGTATASTTTSAAAGR
jgi:mono/diheme cytochrome c family protein